MARLVRISVRTLHHYDGIGLLTPSARSTGGYRLYSQTDLHRLRRVLFYRAVGFGLDEIAQILADAAAGTDEPVLPARVLAARARRELRERRAAGTGLSLGSEPTEATCQPLAAPRRRRGTVGRSGAHRGDGRPPRPH